MTRAEQRPIVTCYHRPGRRHQWRAVGTGESIRAAMAEAERNGCKGGEWRFEESKAEVPDLFAGIE